MPEQFEVLTANPVYYRTYSRWIDGKRETWNDTIDRCIKGLKELGKLTDYEIDLLKTQALAMRSIPSGRWLWVGGTDWVNNPNNFSGAYNCSGFQIDTVYRMAFMMDLLMQGCGAGTLLEQDLIDKLPPINHRVNLEIIGNPGDRKGDKMNEDQSNKNNFDKENILLEKMSNKREVITVYHTKESKEAEQYLREYGWNVSQFVRNSLIKEYNRIKKEGENE